MHALPLADEIFLTAIDENTGKARISDGAMDTMLAGAVLGELLLAGRIGITDATLVVVHRPAPVGEQVGDAALAEITKQPDHYAVRAWVEHLRDIVPALVAHRLVRARLVERVESRSMLKTTIRYPAIDRIAVAAPVARLRYMLDHPRNLDEPTATLAGLILAGNLEFVLGGASPREIRTALSGMAESVKPELRLLIAGVDSAVAALALRASR
jgi:hypothetical protein